MLVAVSKETLLAAADARRQVRRITDKQAVLLVQAWVDAWDTLSPLFAEAVAELVAAGDTVPRAVVARNRKLVAAFEQTRATLEGLTGDTNRIITNDIMDLLLDTVAHHEAVLTTQLPPAYRVQLALGAPSPEALTAIVNRTTQQIHSNTRPLTAITIRRMREQLVRGIVIGDNPMDVARKLMRATEGHFNGGLGRAMTIARTEMLDAHRKGSQAAAEANTDILAGWVWMCTLDGKVCPSCIANHGTLHPVEEFGPIDHQNGRCARVDKTKTWKELGFDIEEPEDDIPDAKAWFDNLTDDSKLAIMGPTRLQMLNDGRIGWADLTTKISAPNWRDSMHVTPVKDLLGSVAK